MRLDDPQIERYSRHIVLPELGPEGQARLLDAQVTVIGSGTTAGRLVRQLAAAGVGRLAADRSHAGEIDPGQTDVTLMELAAERAPAAVAVWVGEPPRRTVRAARTFWILDGRAAELPPCPTCAAAVPPPAAPPAELRAARDAVLASAVATEVLKAICAVGTPLGGRVLCYDPVGAGVTLAPVASRAGCRACGPREEG